MRKKRVILFLLASAFMVIGLGLRTCNTHRYITINTASFFYKRAISLYENGTYPKADALSLAGRIEKEDYPPFLAYFSVWCYRLYEKFFRAVSFSEFLAYIPLIVYVLIFFSGLYIMKEIFTVESGIAFVSFFSVLPAAVRLTSVGYYTSESLGVFLILVSLYLLIMSEEKKYFIYLAALSSTLLILTWQLFTIFFMVPIIRLFIKFKQPEAVKKYLIILCLSIALSQFISVHLIKIAYSPLYVLKEAFIGFISRATPDYAIAFNRVDLKPVRFHSYIQNFGWFGLLFPAFGFTACLNNIKRPQYAILLIGGTIAYLSILVYIKYRMAALPFLLIIYSLGADYIVQKLKGKQHETKYNKKPALS